jgi:hypothetical protein
MFDSSYFSESRGYSLENYVYNLFVNEIAAKQ